MLFHQDVMMVMKIETKQLYPLNTYSPYAPSPKPPSLPTVIALSFILTSWTSYIRGYNLFLMLCICLFNVLRSHLFYSM